MAAGRIAGALMALSIVAAPAYAQSLGEVSRQEEVRRATVKKATIVLSNASLRPDEIAPPADASPATTSPEAAPPAAPCYMSIRKGTCVGPEEMVANSRAGIRSTENAPTESAWRQDAESLRSQIENTRRAIATLETVIANQGRSASDRSAAEHNLAPARQSLADLERRWEKLERAAGNTHIPREWILPIPTLTTRQ